MSSSHNRRRRRSAHKAVALRWFLRSAVLRLGLRALVVGCKNGLVVAAAGDGVDHQTAAAYAPFVFHDGAAYPAWIRGKYFVETLPVDGETLYVFAVGASDGVSLRRSGTHSAIERIVLE